MDLSKTGINWFHALFVGPLLLFVGYQASQGKPSPKWLGWVLILLALGVIGYHSYRIYDKSS